jgi:serine phosphatase RsbU (regulator of sigma subunit)
MLDVVSDLRDDSSTEVIQDLFANVSEFAGDAPQNDDMTVIVLKVS